MTTELLVTVGFALFGLLTALGSLQLRVGTLTSPGSGFFPFVAGSLLALVATYLAAALWYRRRAGRSPERDRSRAVEAPRGNTWLLMACLLAYSAAFAHLGFSLSTFLLLFVLFRLNHANSWTATIVYSVITVAACYLVFAYWFQVYFPTGILGI
jgi:hypothetical protein